MTAEVISIGGHPGDLDRIKEAAKVVEAGGLAVFPTETVYGIACRVEPGTLARLDQIKGVGEALQKKITDLVTTGRLAYHEELKASIPPGLLEMLHIPGLGPKKVKALHDRLGVKTVEQLEAACLAGQVAELDGFGDKTQAKIIEGIQFRRTHAARHPLFTALLTAEPILESLACACRG